MALHVPRSGIGQMMKEGAKHFSGVEEALFRNVDACSQLSETVRTAYGPNGMNKMIINHLEKLFVTNDAATIISQLEVQHPAAKMVILATQMQEQEVGDGTNFVVLFSGALLKFAEELVRMGLTPMEVIEGYELASKKALEILPNLVCDKVEDIRNETEVVRAIRASLMSKQLGNEDFLAKLIAQACISVMTQKSTFNVDNVRVCKILGAGIHRSDVVQGLVFKKDIEGDITKVDNAKCAIYSCPFEAMQTETKGTVLIKTADELMNFSRGEELLLEEQIKAIAASGANVVISGGKIGDMAMHYLNKYKIMAVRLHSKFDLRRVCRTVGGVVFTRMAAPTAQDLGHCDKVYIDEVGDTAVVVLRQEGNESRVCTIVVRGSTENLMDDIERAIDDGVNNYKVISRDGRLVPGAGACEIELAKEILSYGETLPGLEQYAVKKFAEALEAVPRSLAENSGFKPTEVVSQLYAAHHQGDKNAGVNIQEEGKIDALALSILDPYLTKYWGIKYAIDAVCTVLKVDQIIMAKPAGGGPKPREGGGDWDED